MAYWLDLFTWRTWQQFLDAGGTVSGFRQSRWNTVARMKPGDELLCYLTGVSRWIGLLEVTGDPYLDESPIWPDETFPARVPVRVSIALDADTAVPVKELRHRLSYFQDLKSPIAWTGHFRGSPTREKKADALAVIEALRSAEANPVVRPCDPKKLHKRARIYATRSGESLTIPDSEPEVEATTTSGTGVSEAPSHEEIQWYLLKLGHDLGLDLWVARNDRNRTYNGQALSSFGRLRDSVPTQFDDATQRTIELIDVLWLKGNSIMAAFEIEHSTSIYSGLLRMGDLISMQPNLNINLYIVAAESRREKVFEEICRPTFRSLPQPLNECCQYLSYEKLKAAIDDAARLVQHLNPNFLEEYAEIADLG